MKKILNFIFISLLLVSSAQAERTRDIVIRDFNKNVSYIKLDDAQKQKWDEVINSIYYLHDRLGGYGKWSKTPSPWVQYPGHWYVYTNQSQTASVLVSKYAELQVNDYNRVIKEHVAIHNAIEEFDNSLDTNKRKNFRSNFKDLWVYVYDKMTDQLGQQLDKEVSDIKSFTSNIKLNSEQKTQIEIILNSLDKAKKETHNVRSQGKKDLLNLMSNPTISWGDNPMTCKNFFNAYANTLQTYAKSVSQIEDLLDSEQQILFQKNVVNKYTKELDKLSNSSK